MQLVYLPKLRQATRVERQNFEQLPVLFADQQDEETRQYRQELLAAMFHLLHDLEKQLLPYFTKLTPEEFNWMSWLVSPSLAEALVADNYPLPRKPEPEPGLLKLDSLPEALGCAWALLNISQITLQLLPEGKSGNLGLNTELLQQFENLAQIYCTSPADVQAAQQAAKQSLQLMFEKLAPWVQPAANQLLNSRASA
ncbi:hypothetical protein SAMN05660443_2809 [Marinospirillum celere]|uniref:Heme oxygenase n=1 Tax=Marinospirillum celere TaxID=1122252 RepID=A0A1I1JRZ4_9GAMM|nr:hypothetical protein [Marinospirillum celere]SFC48120.1 hypothetical protein SAMN05660443_2809 [Marinospirillum celere]